MSDHSVFSCSSIEGIIVLIVCIDDIILFESGCVDIVDLKAYPSRQFHTKNLGTLRYFLRIEIAQSKMGVSVTAQICFGLAFRGRDVGFSAG